MPEAAAVWLIRVFGTYLTLGAVFALPFVARGIRRIDPAARGASLGFRLVVFPGVVAFWPLLLRRWLAAAPPPEERNAHRTRSRR
ncbi:MAG TPA: hypothetical protein VJS92_14330 [Candidatus Polarisedimenticolaceae bacterium]|nr:hypothetical protein [Candidatus Polarisedimenticolaceae bacterium]